MDAVLNEIDNLILNPDECNALNQMVHQLLEKKKSQHYMNALIEKYQIKGKFQCFTAEKARLSNHRDEVYLTLDYLSADNNENNLYIIMNNDEIIINVIFETDRYVNYDYSKENQYPYGHFQGRNIECVFNNKPDRLTAIQNDIIEIKLLCQYFFK